MKTEVETVAKRTDCDEIEIINFLPIQDSSFEIN